MSEEHLDQRSGAAGVAQTVTGGLPELIVDRGEGTAGPAPGQSGGPGEGPRLEAKDLEVVVEDEHLGALGHGSGVAGHQGAAVVDSPTSAPCSSTRRCQMRREVWRCFLGAS